MATKIDLLPRYVPMRRRLKKWTFAMASVWIATLVFVLAVNSRQNEKLHVLTGNADTMQARADQTAKVEKDTADLVGLTAPSTDAVRFFVDAGKTGGQRAQLIDEVRRYILNSLKVDSIDLSSTSATMQAAVPSRPAYVRAIDVMRRAELDNVFAVGTTKFSGIRTFDNTSPDFAQASAPGAEEIFPDRVNIAATLVNPSTEPAPPGGAAVASTTAGGVPGAAAPLPSSASLSTSSSSSAGPRPLPSSGPR